MNEEFEVVVTSVVVIPKGKTIYIYEGTSIRIEDEGTGEFIKVTQPAERGSISIDKKEWETIKSAIDTMIKNLRE